MWTPPACAPSLPLSSWLHGPCLQGGLPPAGLLLLPTPGTGPLVAFSSHPSSRSEEALTPLQAGPGPGLDVPGPPSPAEGGLQTLFGTSVPQPGQAHIRHPTSCVPRRGHDRAGMGRPLLQPQARWGAGDSREAALSPGGQLGVVLQLGPCSLLQLSRAGVLPSVSFLPPALWWPPHAVGYPRHEGAPQHLSFLLF